MECVTHRNSNLAVYRISREGWDHPERDRLLLHEVLHPVLDGIREEFDFMVTELKNEGQLSSQRATAYRRRHDREVEKVVEHLSHVMYDEIFRPE